MRQVRIGFAGPCPPTRFDENLAQRLIAKALDSIVEANPDCLFALVSGYASVGSLELAYAEAEKRDWWTVGVACQRVYEHPLYPVDEKVVRPEWTEWGSESKRFVEECHLLIVLGDGEQSLNEAALARIQGKQVIMISLPTFRS